jgi:hypothetical protein
MAKIIKTDLPSKNKIHRESLAMLQAAEMFGKLQLLLKAGFFYNYHHHALYIADGFKSKAEWLQALGYSERTERRYLHIAEVMHKVCGGGDDFTFTAALIKEHFADKINRNLTLRELGEYSGNIQQFLNYLSDDRVTLKEMELKKLIMPFRESAKQLPGVEHGSTSLFGPHEKILADGWSWDKENGCYRRPDGSAMTDDELGEYLDEQDAMRVFDVAERELGVAVRQLQIKVESEARMLRAYAKRHTSPAFEKVVNEKLRELSDLAKDILHIIATITIDEEDR